METRASATDSSASESTTSFERSPVDVLRLAVGVVLLAAALILVALFGDRIGNFLGALLDGVDTLPAWLLDLVIVGSRLLATLLVVVGLVAALSGRRWRLLLMTIGSALVAALTEAAIHGFVADDEGTIASASIELGPLTSSGFPSAAGVAAVAASATVIAPWVSRGWRRLAWTLVIAAAIARFMTAPTSLDPTIAALIGWVVGSLALVVLGGPVRRPTDAAVAAALGSVGVPVATIAKAEVDARGSTPYFATGLDGESLFVKALGADQRSADLLFRAYRRIVPRDLGDERSFSSLRRTVEHEALVALAAADIGVRTPRFRAFAHVPPDAFVLAYEGIEGSSLDGVDADKFDDELLGAVWGQLAMLRRHRIAHRDLRLANVFRAVDGEIWIIDFGFSELAASDLLLATDLAELVASTSLVVGPDQALEAGLSALGGTDLAAASTRLHPFALSGATRTAMKEREGLLDQLRARTAAMGSV